MFQEALSDLMQVCGQVFGEAFDYTPVNGETRQIANCIFDHNYQTVDLQNGAEVASVHPAIGVHEKDFPDPIQLNDRFTHIATGREYRVINVQPDSGYRLLVILHSVA